MVTLLTYMYTVSLTLTYLQLYLLQMVFFLFFRYKKSSREVETLKIVQQELTKLDNLLTEDVAILRKKIEETNKLYNSAR